MTDTLFEIQLMIVNGKQAEDIAAQHTVSVEDVYTITDELFTALEADRQAEAQLYTPDLTQDEVEEWLLAFDLS